MSRVRWRAFVKGAVSVFDLGLMAGVLVDEDVEPHLPALDQALQRLAESSDRAVQTLERALHE
jgi:hypothetical protein